MCVYDSNKNGPFSGESGYRFLVCFDYLFLLKFLQWACATFFTRKDLRVIWLTGHKDQRDFEPKQSL